MDLLILFFVVFGGAIVVVVLLSMFHPGSGADLLDWDPSKRMEKRYAAEFEDMEEMLRTHNRRRRERGLPEQTEDEFHAQMLREDRGQA